MMPVKALRNWGRLNDLASDPLETEYREWQKIVADLGP